MLKKIISSILIIIILLAWFPIEPISKAVSINKLNPEFNQPINIFNLDKTANSDTIEEEDEKEISTNAGNIETIDLTGIIAGTDTIHKHIYERKYDDNEHWQECWICHNKINIAPHTLTEYEEPACGSQTIQHCTDTSCSYSKVTKKEHTFVEQYQAQGDSAQHGVWCSGCNKYYLVRDDRSNCVDSAGNRLRMWYRP